MIIEGSGPRRVDIIELLHNGTKNRFALRMRPFGECLGERILQDNCVLIQFDDTYEVDELIRVLQHFKDLNYAHFGEWRYMP